MPYVILNGAGYTNFDNAGNLTGVGGISVTNFAPVQVNPYLCANALPKDGDPIVPVPGSDAPACTANLYTRQDQGLVYIPQTNATVTVTQPIPTGYQVRRGRLSNGALSPYSFIAKTTPQ